MNSTEQYVDIWNDAGAMQRDARSKQEIADRAVYMEIADIAIVNGAKIHHAAEPLIGVDSQLATSTIGAERGNVSGRIEPSIGVTEKGPDSWIILRTHDTYGKDSEGCQTRYLLH